MFRVISSWSNHQSQELRQNQMFFPKKSQNVFIYFFVLLHWSFADDGLLMMMDGP